jgi:hypothetical protein
MDMSELKHQLMMTKEHSWVFAYPKSEADKVIAELKADYQEACDRLQTANLIKDEQLAETRYQMRKRYRWRWRNFVRINSELP